MLLGLGAFGTAADRTAAESTVGSCALGAAPNRNTRYISLQLGGIGRPYTGCQSCRHVGLCGFVLSKEVTGDIWVVETGRCLGLVELGRVSQTGP